MTDYEHDALVEEIARKVQELSLIDIMGIGAKRKRAREDAELRMNVRKEQRDELARLIRAFKRGGGLDPLAEIVRIAESGGEKIFSRFIDIRDEEAAGYVEVKAIVPLSQNWMSPGGVEFVATLTEKGRRALPNPAERTGG